MCSTHRKAFLLGGVFFCVTLLALWAALPSIAQWYLNRALSHVEGYQGQVGTVGLHHLLRGAVVINEVEIKKQNGKVYLPFVSIKKTDFTLQWGELFRGSVVGDVRIFSPTLNFVHGPTETQSQLTVEKEWQDVVGELLPIRINHLKVQDGELHFVSVHTKPKVDLFLKDIQIEGKNLSNAREKGEEYFSTIDLSASAPGGGTLKMHAKTNPLTKPLPAFKLSSELRDVDLVALNDFFKAYGNFDVNRGKFDFFFEMDSTPTTYKGYAKPILSQIDVLDWEKDSQKKNFIQIAWKAMVGTVVSIFKNQPKDQLATKAPFSGSWKDTDVGIFETVLNLFKNAFVQALLPGFERGGGK